jgi:class 3 adenylate cyclase/tetratricopeptide (TPR) repeat protein
VTILFSDLVGSTALGEQLDPEALRTLMAQYFDEVSGVIQRHGGVVEKFIGDAVMAVFGIPTLHEDDALRAVRAAEEVGTRLRELNSELAARGITLTVRTGINTGEVVAGDPFTGQSLATGDAVNTAARLEQLAEPDEVLIGESTFRLVRDAVTVESRAPLEAKGRAKPLTAYRLVSVSPTAEAVTRHLEAPLLGRDSELARLIELWQRTRADAVPRLVTVLGVAGVGKSRLLGQLTRLVSADDRVLYGRSLPYGEGITYWPLRNIVHAAAGITDADSAERAQSRIVHLLADEPQARILAERVATAISLTDTVAPQEELFWAVRRLFEQLARERPTVIILEDLQWAEDTLLDLIEYTVDLAANAPLLLLTAARPELLEAHPGWGTGRPSMELIRIDPLPSDVSMELVRAQPGGEAVPRPLAERIAATAEGNPLFVEGMVAMLRDDGSLTQDAHGVWRFQGAAATVRVPPTVRALLAARLDRLDPADRVIAERASIIGRSFESAALAELVPPETSDHLGRLLLGLVRRELIEPEHNELTGRDAFRFRHILVRDVAYESLPKALRAELHQRFARWLEASTAERVAEFAEILGYHLEQAHRYLVELGVPTEDDRLTHDAVTYLALAGRRADLRGDRAGAENLLGRALNLRPELSRERTELLLAVGRVQRDRGDFPAARRSLGDARTEAIARGDDLSRARADVETVLLDFLNPTAGWVERAREMLPEAGRLLKESHDAEGLASQRMAEGTIHELEGRNGAAAEAFADALALARAAENHRLQHDATARVLLNVVLGETPVSIGLERCEEVLAEWGDQPRVMLIALDSYASLLGLAGRFDEGIEAERGALAIAADLNDRVNEGLLRSQGLAMILALRGDLREAAEEGHIGCKLLEQLGAHSWLATSASLLGEILLATGDVEGARHWLSVAERATVSEDIDAVTRGLVLRARLAVVDREADAGFTYAHRAMSAVEGSELLYLRGIASAGIANVLWSMNRTEEARELYLQAIALHERKGAIGRADRVRQMMEMPELAGRVPLA